MPVLVCGLAGNPEIYQVGMGCSLDDMGGKWWKYPKIEDQKKVFHKQRSDSEREVEKIIRKLFGK